jgi:NAD(P)-dependent dehydrogenase (short-subunit alcohol dehydrogenase family)
MAIVFITGTSTGIGFATAVTLAQNGHKVYASMRNPQQSPELQNLAEKENLPIHIITMDVTDEASVKDGFEGVLQKEGFIDVLINNAGIAKGGAVEELPLDSFEKEMQANYFGTVRCIKEVLPSMRERKAGCIINNTSIAARFNGQFQSGYCASKAAVEAFSESLAQEVQPYNIRIAIVEPGVIMTPIFSKNQRHVSINYPNIKRLIAFFAASLERQTSPTVVADVINDIIDGKSKKFRNLAGPDALPLISARTSMTDEEWINSVNIDDATWIENMSRMGLNVKPYLTS